MKLIILSCQFKVYIGWSSHILVQYDIKLFKQYCKRLQHDIKIYFSYNI